MMFSIIIPTYRRVDALVATLQSISALENSDWEVLVVDQSPPELAEKIKDALEREINEGKYKYIHLKKPSLALARNEGLKQSQGQWVIYCDDDVIWGADLLDKFIHRIKTTPRMVMAGGLDYEHPGDKKNLLFRILRRMLCIAPFRQDSGYVMKSMLARYPDVVNRPLPTQWAMGYWFSVKREFLMSHNLKVDENLSGYSYSEDMDFTYRIYLRAKSLSMECLIFPEIGVRHMVSGEWRTPADAGVRAVVSNRIYFLHKNLDGFNVVVGWGEFLISLMPLCVFYAKRGCLTKFLKAMWYALTHLDSIIQGKFA